MVVDVIANAGLYTGLGDRISRALTLLATERFAGMATGRHEVDGDSLYYMVQSYQSKPFAQGKWESHRRYIDIQYVVEGVERMGWASLGAAAAGNPGLQVTMPYDPAKDAALYVGDGDLVTMAPGTFMILWPQDAHMPGIAVKDPVPVLKIVVKVLV
jgi:biofilm protein TabA